MINSYVISVSLKTGCYRHIQISAARTLLELSREILNAFDFCDDQAHAFFMNNRLGDLSDAYYKEGANGESRTTNAYRLGEIGLKKDDKFKYLFDFEKEWAFQCRVLRELEEETKEAEVIRSVGESPEQNPDEKAAEAPETAPAEKAEGKLPLDGAVVDTIRTYFAAAANLYGTIPVLALREIYNRQNDPVSVEDFLAVAEAVRHTQNTFAIVGREPQMWEVRKDYLYPNEAYGYLRRLQGRKPFALLPKEAFLQYADDHYVPETRELVHMRSYLEWKTQKLSVEAEVALSRILLDIQLEAAPANVVEHLSRLGVGFSDLVDMNRFMMLLHELNTVTRKSCHRGHTILELTGANPAKSAAPVTQKVGRNAPCPCGSGKKYKNCCGSANGRR